MGRAEYLVIKDLLEDDWSVQDVLYALAAAYIAPEGDAETLRVVSIIRDAVNRIVSEV